MIRILILVIAVFIISCSPVSRYKNDPLVLSWEEDIRQFERLDSAEQYPKDAILFAGSSSIRLWSSLPSDMAPYQVIQRGYGGARLSDLAFYSERIFSPHPCRAIVIFVANDIVGDKTDKSPRKVGQLFRYTLGVIRKTHPDTPVFWIAITPTAARWAAWEEIQKANDRIRQVCEAGNNTYFIRTDTAFLSSDMKPRTELFIEDKLHLNQDGYAIWTRIVKGELDRVLSGR